MASVNFTLEEARLSSIPVGTIIDYYGSSQPDGWLICDGRAVPDSMPKLKALIGAKTPDLRGRFRRMIGGNAAGMGVAQGDLVGNHNHKYQDYSIYDRGGSVGYYSGLNAKLVERTTTTMTNVETRPINMAFNTLIYGGGGISTLFKAVTRRCYKIWQLLV